MSEKLSTIFATNPTSALGTGCLLYIYNPAIVSPTNRSSAVTADSLFANPTAQTGTAAVNGAAFTAMRSDAAPALNLGISPTWTGNHNFTNVLSSNGQAHLNGITSFPNLAASSVLALDASHDVVAIASLITNGMLYATGSGTFASTAAPTNGQLLVGSTGSNPVLATLSGTSNQINITNGAGTITLSLPNPVVPNAVGFQIAAGTTPKTLKVDNTLELAGTDGTKFTFPAASDTVAGLATAQTFTQPQTMGQGIFQNTTDYVLFGNSTDQTSSGAGGVVLSWDTNIRTTNALMHSQTVNPTRLIAPTTGLYRLTLSPIIVDDATCIGIFISARKNGTTTIWEGGIAAFGTGTPNSCYGTTGALLYLTANDYIEIFMVALGGTVGLTWRANNSTYPQALSWEKVGN